ncbi:ComF family protein [Bacillaceae bacterium S4-13-58]
MTHCLWCDIEIIPQITWETFLIYQNPSPICEKCDSMLQLLQGTRCLICNREHPSGGLCFDCERWEQNPQTKGLLTTNHSLYTYNDSMKEIMAKWKFRGDYVLIQMFQEKINKAYKKLLSKSYQPILVPIPLSEERSKERGFNQAEAIAECMDPKRIQHPLQRITSEKQSKKTRYDRLHSQNPFTIQHSITQPVLLIDDIYTTGSTLRQAAAILKSNGCPEVRSFTLIRG